MIPEVRKDLPTGTVTFLFTDIEGSTRLLGALGDRYGDALEAQRALLRQAFADHGGIEVDTQGDAFFAVFRSAGDAVQAAAQVQRSLAVHDWAEGVPVRVRVGVHTGEPARIAEGYVGADVHRGARICAAAHGGQVLVSQATRDLVGEEPGDGLALRDLGEHRLKDLTLAQTLYQLLIDGLESRFPAIRTLENRPTNLPLQPTALIGREAELADAARLMGMDDVRLLTLTGPGGTGKTRLALQVAAELLDDFPDGVFFVTLAPISDPGLVTTTVAQTFAVRERPGETLDETLGDYLRERRLLLLLDNFEQVVAGAPAVSALLAGAPGLKVLATSRAPLRVAGEHELAVPPLRLPDLIELPELEALSQYEAVELFVQRALAVKTDFALTNENAPAVAEICVRLDGLPLAIELAAARVRALPPGALLERLGQRLGLLTHGPRDAPTRQQTLRAAIDWSYALLSEPEQRLFAQLSVFLRSWDLEGAEAVADPNVAVVDVLESLVENSLVRQAEEAAGGSRYFMLETIREYAGELLAASPDADAMRRRHAKYVLLLAERANAVLTGTDFSLAGEPEARIVEELPNIRAALEWALDRDETLALHLAVTAVRAWALNGLFAEGRTWLSRALETAGHPESVDGAWALSWIGMLLGQEGDLRAATQFDEQALALFERHGDDRGAATVLVGLAFLACEKGDVQRARSYVHEARHRADLLEDDFVRIELLTAEFLVDARAGDYDRAQTSLDEALALYRTLGVPRRSWIHQLINVGWIALHRHDYGRAREALEEYLAAESRKNPVGIANAEVNLAFVALCEDDRDEADRRCRQALVHARESRARRTIAPALLALAAVAAIDGDPERAVRLCGAADGLMKSMEAPLWGVDELIVERHLVPAGEQLPDDVRERAEGEGAAMSLDEAIDYALDEGEA
jgi:predicted ATPase/class 3 adenylate cyclase